MILHLNTVGNSIYTWSIFHFINNIFIGIAELSLMCIKLHLLDILYILRVIVTNNSLGYMISIELLCSILLVIIWRCFYSFGSSIHMLCIHYRIKCIILNILSNYSSLCHYISHICNSMENIEVHLSMLNCNIMMILFIGIIRTKLILLDRKNVFC